MQSVNKKIFIPGVFLILLISSCSKIQPEITKNNQDMTQEKNEIHKSSNACWIITCETMESLSKLEEEWKLKLPDLKYYRDRFSVIAKKYPKVEELLESQEFKKYTNDLNIDFFSCSWDFHYCEPKNRNYWYNETNYLFYVFIPSIVIEQYSWKEWITEEEKEDIIQALKRKDFMVNDVKNNLIDKYKDDLRQKINKIDFSYIDRKKLKEDKLYFNEIILSPGTWLYDKLIYESQHTGINWQSEEQMEEIIQSTIDIFYKKLEELWISKKYFDKIVNINDTINDLKNTTLLLNKKYSLENKMPVDRFYRNDELYIFNEKNIKNFESEVFWNDKNYLKDVLKIRHDTYLLFLLWGEENLFFLPNRMNKLNFDNWFIATNIFEYTKNLNIDIKY